MQTPSKNINKISDRQVRVIVERVKDSVEKQLLVLDFLDNLEEGKTPVKPTKSRSKEVCDTDPDYASDEPGFDIDDKEELNRHAMKYSGWRKSLCLELLSFVEPNMFHPAKKTKLDSATLAKQLMEFGFGLVVLDEKASDKPMTKVKKEAFERLRSVYISLGKRFRNLELASDKGFSVDWSKHGIYKVEHQKENDDEYVQLTDKFAAKKVVLPSELVEGIKLDYFTNDKINRNWSQLAAVLVFPNGETLECHTLFPKLKRTLTKQLSQEHKVAEPRLTTSPLSVDGVGDAQPAKKAARVSASRQVVEKPRDPEMVSTPSPTLPRAGSISQSKLSFPVPEPPASLKASAAATAAFLGSQRSDAPVNLEDSDADGSATEVEP